MNFILIDDVICIATHFSLNNNLEKQKFVNASTIASSKHMTVSREITGSVLLFAQESLPDLFGDDGTPNMVEIQYKSENWLYLLKGVMFTSLEYKNGCYDNCTCVYGEYLADALTTEELSQTISSVTLNR